MERNTHMSTMTLTYFSKALIGCIQINLYLPIGAEYEDMVQAGEKFQVLWLLHGGGNYSEWARYTCIEKLAMDHKFAVVMPEGGFSCLYSMTPAVRRIISTRASWSSGNLPGQRGWSRT